MKEEIGPDKTNSQISLKTLSYSYKGKRRLVGNLPVWHGNYIGNFAKHRICASDRISGQWMERIVSLTGLFIIKETDRQLSCRKLFCMQSFFGAVLSGVCFWIEFWTGLMLTYKVLLVDVLVLISIVKGGHDSVQKMSQVRRFIVDVTTEDAVASAGEPLHWYLHQPKESEALEKYVEQKRK